MLVWQKAEDVKCTSDSLQPDFYPSKPWQGHHKGLQPILLLALPTLSRAPFLLVMLSVKVTGTILRAACQLTFIKQAIKLQITGLYGFIILDAMLCRITASGWGLKGRGVSEEAGRMFARGGWFSGRFVVLRAVTTSVFAQDRRAFRYRQSAFYRSQKKRAATVKTRLSWCIPVTRTSLMS